MSGSNPEVELKKEVNLYFASLSESEKRELFNDLDNQKFDGIEFLCFLYAKLKNYFDGSHFDNQSSNEEIEIEKYQGMTKSEYEEMCFA